MERHGFNMKTYLFKTYSECLYASYCAGPNYSSPMELYRGDYISGFCLAYQRDFLEAIGVSGFIVADIDPDDIIPPEQYVAPEVDPLES